MFWNRAEQDHPDEAREHVREYVRERLMVALDFATLGAYELLPEGEGSGSDTDCVEAGADRSSASRGESESHRDLHAVPTAEAEAADTPSGMTDETPAPDHTASPSATALSEHRGSAAPRLRTSIRSGTRCDAPRRLPCALDADSQTADDSQVASSSGHRLNGRHAARRARRPGRPPVPEQPCSWTAWLSEPQP